MDDTTDAARLYRELAATMRQRAAGMKDSNNRAVMLSAAEGYERLADVIENPNRRQGFH